MGRLLLVVNMETSPLLFTFLIFLAAAAGRTTDPEISDELQEEDFLGKHGVQECDPKKAKPCSKSNMRCEDDAGDGHWECTCVAGYKLDSDGLCEPSVSDYQDDSNGVYRIDKVSKKVFYFGKRSEDFTDAVEVCKQAFQGNGKLFEPKTDAMNTNIGSPARSVNNNSPFWIGVRTRPHNEDRAFYYLSEDPSKDLKIKPWSAGEPNDLSGQEDCVAILNNGAYTWDDVECDQADTYAICELNEEEACGKPEFANDNYCDDENNKASCNYDGGACCNRDRWEFKGWNDYCTDCECLDPNARPESGPPTTPIPGPEDLWPSKKCKKCNKKKCTKDKKGCMKMCKKTCSKY